MRAQYPSPTHKLCKLSYNIMAVYIEIPYQESLKNLKSGELTHAAHAMIYAKWPGALFGKYQHKYAVMVRK